MASMEARRLLEAGGGVVGVGDAGVGVGVGRQEVRRRARTRTAVTVQRWKLWGRESMVILYPLR